MLDLTLKIQQGQQQICISDNNENVGAIVSNNDQSPNNPILKRLGSLTCSFEFSSISKNKRHQYRQRTRNKYYFILVCERIIHGSVALDSRVAKKC